MNVRASLTARMVLIAGALAVVIGVAIGALLVTIGDMRDAARMTACANRLARADRSETAHAGGALIVKPGSEFSLVAEDGAAEAVCMLPVGGTALLDGQRIVPPWAV